jgi:hypothetical protein
MKNVALETLLPSEFSDDARVWIFQGGRPFREQEEQQINEQLLQFYSQWETHGKPVHGWGRLLFSRFVIVMAEEDKNQVSGCSTDGMIRLIKSLERQYHTTFFDRMMVTVLHNDKAEMLPFAQIQHALNQGILTRDSLVFNNIATTKKELLSSWLVPMDQSWIAQRINF